MKIECFVLRDVRYNVYAWHYVGVDGTLICLMLLETYAMVAY